MNKYFDTVVNRRGTGALKWDIGGEELPMWVADMDFRTAPGIIEALTKRAEYGVFGYNIVPDEWYDAYISWWQRRHDFTIERDWLIFCTGVVPAISSIVRKLTTPAEKVVVQTPVYNIFFNSILNNGRVPLESPLRYRDGKYDIDFDALEKALSDPQTTLMLLCNPHNPAGRVWERETLAKIGELCEKHHVTVVSDEIHCDLTYPGIDYVPFASASETCRRISVTCIAPTKTFSIAGIQTAAVVIPDPFLRHKVNRGLNTDECAEPNSFAVTAAVAAYNTGEEWLDELRAYLAANKSLVRAFVENELEGIRLVEAEATYLLWLDCSCFGDKAPQVAEFIRRDTGLFLSEGSQYGKGGENFIRMNIACPQELLVDGLNRLRDGIRDFAKI